MAYVYWVKNITTGLKYVGVKHAKGCVPEDFWVSYFTSSPRVHALIDSFGKDDFKFKILKTFESTYEALCYENKMIRLALLRDDYVNLHPNFIGEMGEEEYELHKENQRKAASIVGTLCVLTKSGIFSLSEEERKGVCSVGGFAAARVNKEKGAAVFDPSVRERQHATLRERQVSAYYDPELRQEISSKGGKNGMFSKAYAERNGLTEEERIEQQRERGRKGGPKNKGSRFYTDGEKTFKYTKKMQEALPFEDFLTNNPQFRAGRTLVSKKESF